MCANPDACIHVLYLIINHIRQYFSITKKRFKITVWNTQRNIELKISSLNWLLFTNSIQLWYVFQKKFLIAIYKILEGLVGWFNCKTTDGAANGICNTNYWNKWNAFKKFTKKMKLFDLSVDSVAIVRSNILIGKFYAKCSPL